MRKKILKTYGIVFLLVLLCSQEGFTSEKKIKMKEIGFFTGRGCARLEEKDDYEVFPVGLRLGFNTESLFQNIEMEGGLRRLMSEDLELVVEPYIAGINSPESNFECGTGLLIRLLHRFNRLAPFIEIGTGVQYTTQHTREEGTQLCFQLQGGGGIYYFFKKDKAISFTYRFRHFSNAGTKNPNTGIDVHCFLIGLSYFFN